MQVWRVKGGERVATMQVMSQVWCIAVSKDSRWIAAGLHNGEVLVWDATTYEQVIACKAGEWPIRDIDFSPTCSTRLVSSSDNSTAVVWNIAAASRFSSSFCTLYHDQWVAAAKYSPGGDRIATASSKSIRVWDSDDGRLLADIKMNVELPRDLLWFNNHLVVKTDLSKVKQINASTGSTISKWSVPRASYYSCIALPQHGKFLVYSADDTITFSNTSSYTRRLGLIRKNHDIRFLTFSPDNHFLAIATSERKVIIDVSITKVRSSPAFESSIHSWLTSCSRSPRSISTALCSMHGSTTNSSMRKSY